MGLLQVFEPLARRIVNLTNTKDCRKQLPASNHCTFASDWVFDIYIGDICELHDLDYRKGGNEKDRKKADEVFEDRLRQRGVETGKKKEFSRIADVFYRMVRTFGWTRFQYKL